MWKLTIFSLLLLLAPVGVFAAEVQGLYEAEVPVVSQKHSERATAMVSALTEVLAKVSGRRAAALQAELASALQRPARFLEQYSYRELPAELGVQHAPVSGVSPDEKSQLLLFRFDKAAVDKLLRDNGLPVWGATRPATLVWLAVQNSEQRYLLSSDSVGPVRELLTREARRRGLALYLPLLDLEDQKNLRFADVWGNFREPILRASARYRTETVLVGKLYRSASGGWQGQWSLLEDGQAAHAWTGNGALPVEVINTGVAGAIEALAARYAPAAGGQGADLLPVTVAEVRTLADYARVSRYLQSLQQVAHVQLSQVEADRVTFELDVEGGPEAFRQTIALGSVLVLQTPTANEARWMPPDAQVYRLLP
jgi:hypothetical protein